MQLLFKGVWSFSLRALMAVFGFLFSVSITRSLPVDEAGLFFFCVSIVTPFAILSRVGTDQHMIKEGACALDPKQVSMPIISLVGALGLVVFTLVALGNWVIEGPEVLYVFCISGLGISIAASLSNYFQVKESMFWVYWGRGLGVNILASFPLLLAVSTSLNITLSGVAYVYAGATVLVVGMLAWRAGIRFVWHPPINLAPIYHKTRYFMASEMLNQLQLISVPVVIGVVLSMPEVALFTAALKVALLMMMAVTALHAVVATRMATLYKDDQQEALQRLYFVSLNLMMAMSLATLALNISMGDLIMSLFGGPYQDSQFVLVILTLAYALVLCSSPAAILLNMSSNEAMTFKANALSVALLITTLPLLIFDQGVEGGAIAILISQAGRAAFLINRIRRDFGFSPGGKPSIN